MKKSIMISFSIICLSIISVVFIKQSNDHSECGTITETEISDDGLTTATTNKHICNEKYNL